MSEIELPKPNGFHPASAYTAEQGREVYIAALMEAAKMCDEAPYLGKEAADCADIIRARAAAIRRGSV